MKKFRMGVLLHFFQPYWQFPNILRMITEQCYRPIFKFIRNNPDKFAFTANINYSLLELLKKNGYEDILDDIRFAVEHNLIELVGTAAYHPILPLIPEKERGKQIAYDFQQKQFLGIKHNCRGFFFPEMAFSKNCLPLLKEAGFQWTIAEDVAVPKHEIPHNCVFSADNFSIFLRSHHWSEYVFSENYCLDFKTFAEKINYELPAWVGDNNCYIVIAMDAETFGHHLSIQTEAFLFPLIKNWGGNVVVPFEDMRKIFPVREFSEINDSSWATSQDDIYWGNPFPLWKDKDNLNHFILWQLVELALKHADNRDAVHDCLKMVNSCHWWQISRARWNPGFMIIGAEKAFEVVMKFGDESDKEKARYCIKFLNYLR